jgi:hypothetical protein
MPWILFEREVIDVSSSVIVSNNKNYRFLLHSTFECLDVFAVWHGQAGVTPAGRISVLFDGNPGKEPVFFDMGNPTTNSYKFNMHMPFLDMDVAGLSRGGAVQIYFR